MGWPPFTKNLKITIAVLGVLFLLQAASPDFHVFVAKYLLVSKSAVLENHSIWTIFTYALFHADAQHILFNSVALWSFGAYLDQMWSNKRFWTFCFLCALGGGVATVLWQLAAGTDALTLGYSGVVTGLIAAFCLYNWNRRFNLLFIPMTGALLLFLMPVIDIVLILSGSNISFAGHMGGMITGLLLTHFGSDQTSILLSGARKRSEASDFQKELLADAREALDEHDFREAYRICHQLRSGSGSIPQSMLDEVWTILAISSFEQELYDEARTYLDRAPDSKRIEELRERIESQPD